MVLTALEKDPKKRFASIREFALAFEQVAQADMDVSEQTVVPAATRMSEALQEPASRPVLPNPVPVRVEPTPPSTSSAMPLVRIQAAGTIVSRYRGHLAPVTSLAWSPDSRRIISVSGEKTVHAWNASTGSKAIYNSIQTCPTRCG